jgi:hypothetical protein
VITPPTSREAIQAARSLELHPSWGDAKTVHRIFGISRTPLYRLMAAGAIKTASLQEEGTGRGKRLFHLPSIAELLESKAQGGTAR